MNTKTLLTIAAFGWLFCFAITGCAQTLGSGVLLGGGTSVGGTTPTPVGTPIISLSGNTVTISNCGSKSAFYSTSTVGYHPATIASNLYSAPFTIPTGVDTYVTAICATMGAYQTNTQASTNGLACGTALGGTWGSWTCALNGGVGTVNPSNLVWTVPGGASPMTATITAPASTASSVQALFKFQYGGTLFPSAPVCDLCSKQVKAIVFTVIGSGMENQEFDSPQFNNTDGVDRQNGTQCQGSSGKIEVDSGNAGGWTPTTAPCANWTAGTTHEVINSVSHNSDPSCPGGNGCALYDYIWIDGTNYPLLGDYSHTQGYNSNPGKAWGWQFQPDMLPTSGSAVTGGWTIISATVALGFGDESLTVSALYHP